MSEALVAQDGPHCQCQEGWYGDDCNQHVMNTTSYLPSQSALAPCSEHLSDARRLDDHLQKTQHPGRCDVNHLRPAKAPVTGFGSILLHMVKCLSLTFKAGYMYEVPEGTLAVFTQAGSPDRPCDQSLRCYSRPASDCAPSVQEMAKYTGAVKAKKDKKNKKTPHIGHLQPTVYKGKQVRDCPTLGTNKKKEPLDTVPDGFEKRSLFWYHSKLLGYLWQPITSLATSLAKAKEEISWEHPIIAMHVRHGDSCKDHRGQRQCRSFEDYLVAARSLKGRQKNRAADSHGWNS
ncbi:hypothetical protein CYMTET_33673 [Cymbomonas tetramitiformis]|uniref:EGF-like domain-containing protein n=1 Tax=Cymbomonas tetramitiformis TaxID=36881 RepID=A0AAE0FCL0_9CHLO|nr:hypothetical protein CYMTET_33673 [Cymbomonas tetramitiformis]